MGLGFLGAIGFWGCADPSAAEQQNLRKQLEQAIALIHAAEAGFVPDGSETPNAGPPSLTIAGRNPSAETADPDYAKFWSVDLQAYRLKKLEEATQILESIFDKGSNSLQITSRRLLGDAYAAQINEQTRLAMTHWTQLAHEASDLYSRKMDAIRAAWNSKKFESDEAEVQVLAAIRQTQTDGQKRLIDLDNAIADLRSKSEQLTQVTQSLRAAADEATALALELRTKALVAVDKQQDELYNQAQQTQRRADKAAADARQAQVNQDLYDSELAILTQQKRLIRESQRSLSDQASDAEARRREISQKRQESLNDKAISLGAMEEKSNQILSAWAEGVDKPFGLAAQRAEDGVNVLKKALPLATDLETKRLVQLDLLARMVQKAHVLSSHLLVTRSQIQLMLAMAEGADVWANGAQETFTANADQAKARLKSLWEAADLSLQEAAELSQALTQDAEKDEPVTLAAAQLSARISSYRRQIDGLHP